MVIFCEEIYFNNVFYNFLPYIHKNQMAFSAIQRYLNLQYHKGKYKLIITAHYSGKKGGNAHIAINQCWKYTILGQFLVRCYQSFFFSSCNMSNNKSQQITTLCTGRWEHSLTALLLFFVRHGMVRLWSSSCRPRVTPYR